MRRGDDSNRINSPPPQGAGMPNLAFRNRIEGNQHIESPPIPNRVPRLHVPNVMVIDKPFEEQMEMEESLEEHKTVLQEDLDASGLEDSPFLFTTNEAFEDAQLLFEDDTYQENTVQTCSKVTKAPLKGPRNPNE